MELPSGYNFQGWNIRYNLTGSNNTSQLYRPIIEALQAKSTYQILVYDLPGYGQSQEFNSKTTATTSNRDFLGDTSVKFQSKALAALLKHAKLDGQEGHPTPAVIAHDIAGAIVLRAHLLDGCEFDTMLLVDTNAVLPWGDGFYKLIRSEPQPFMKLPPSIFEAVVRAVTQSACHDPKILQTGWEDVLARPWIGRQSDGAGAVDAQQSFVRQIAQADDADVAEMLDGDMYEEVRCDVKIIWGEQDQWIPREKIEELTKRLHGRVKESAFIPDAGHLVMLDQPTRFAIEVFDWLTRFGSSKSLMSS
ncbi:hypothetical protein LTR37_008854 [Vermiconidia calcicola]|uniref:Uncharacterized protein n=1 Tax=Vermiconidia calcicola TaxID=1690605 RepID=A0ACC3N991_9PEZI|nr:hypothetical protein LTR37_008854 [Vermiconidia calcicola]